MSAHNTHTNSFVLTDVLLFTGSSFISNALIVVDDGTIRYAGPNDPTIPIPNLPILSKSGYTLIPGLIDSHVHGLEGNVDSLAQSLRFGVTTVCDMHNDPRSILKLQKVSQTICVHSINAWPS